MKKIKLLLLTFILLFSCTIVQAKENNHMTIKIGNDIKIEGSYNSSIIAMGQTVTTNTTVDGISAILGNDITVKGQSDYSILIGNSIQTKGTTNKDSFILGNIITTNKDSTFKRDVVVAGSDIILNGNFNRDVTIYAQKVTIKNATIKNNVKIYAEKIITTKNTTIEGTLYYPEDSIYKNNNANINKVAKTDAIQTTNDENYLNTLSAKFWSFLCLTLIFGAISLFFPKAFYYINKKYESIELSETVEVFTKGLVIIILVPVIAVLLCCTMVGIPLGIILVLLYGISIYISPIFTAYLIGYKIWQKVLKNDAHILFFGILGLFILLILGLIPGVRILVSIITTLVGLGLIFDCLEKTK